MYQIILVGLEYSCSYHKMWFKKSVQRRFKVQWTTTFYHYLTTKSLCSNYKICVLVVLNCTF